MCPNYGLWANCSPPDPVMWPTDWLAGSSLSSPDNYNGYTPIWPAGSLQTPGVAHRDKGLDIPGLYRQNVLLAGYVLLKKKSAEYVAFLTG